MKKGLILPDRYYVVLNGEVFLDTQNAMIARCYYNIMRQFFIFAELIEPTTTN